MANDGPSIPNLLSHRGTRPVRSRGRGGRFVEPLGRGHDQAIQGTDDDAATSRLSAVSLGYLNDPFAQFFVQTAMGEPPRRLPIINRVVGTYTRTCALDRLIDSFLCGDQRGGGYTPDEPGQRQIISLGAGSDTRIFRLLSNKTHQHHQSIIYHELDFPVSVRKKAHIVQGVPALRTILGTAATSDDGSWSCQLPRGEYYCHAIDLRTFLHKDEQISVDGLRQNVPTLLISECCLCYLETQAAVAVVDWFATRIPSLATIIYEPIRPDDPFGKMMVANLAHRKIRMPTLESYPSLHHQEIRLQTAGFEQVRALTVRDIWNTWFTPAEKERVNSIEGLDEVEEWHLLADHYVVAWAWRNEGASLWHGHGQSPRTTT